MIVRRLAILSAAVLAALVVAGCGQMGYLAQSLNGHMRMMSAAEPVSTLLARPDLDPKLRERLQLSQRLRDYAIAELHLPDNNSYRRYADLHRNAAVWNVIAAPELSLKARTWCYPIMGCVAYRGYFDQAAAEAYARGLREDDEHLEVMVGPVPAYSTLGWSTWLGGDPLLNTFIGYPEGELARMMFHELAHQVAYADDDTTFNESFATAVERIGAARWLNARGSDAAREIYERGNQRRLQFRALTDAYRLKLAAVYDSGLDDDTKRAAKARTMQALREDYAKLKTEAWGGYSGYDDWFARANNASFALLSAYGELVPAFEALFEREGEDWPRFYAEVKRLAKLPKSDRRRQLESH